jgi:tripartite-type tricarboxylate transporter receptor subunit TctC
LMTPDEFGAHVQAEIEKWAKIIKANAITGE